MSFQTPFEPESPSTPDKSRSFLSDVSTTPAGLPPAKGNSFASRLPQPSTSFGNSLFGQSGMENDSIFGSSTGSDHFMPPPRANNPTPSRAAPSRSLFSMTNGSRFGESITSEQPNDFTSSQMEAGPEDEMEEEEYEDQFEEEQESDMDVDKAAKKSGPRFSFLDSSFGNMAPPQPSVLGQRKPIYSNPANAKRPKLDERWTHQSPLRKPTLPPKKDSKMPSIVRTFASRSRLAAVEETSDVILSTEDEVCRMYEEARQAEERGTDFLFALSGVSGRLTDAWKSYVEQSGVPKTRLGPGEQAPNVAKASFLGSLLLQIHHPPVVSPKTESPFGAFGRLPQSLVLARPDEGTLTPIPKVLLDWLNANHVSQSGNLQALKETEPNPTASPNFWETVTTTVLRGRLGEAAGLLRSADFNYARSALEDGLPQPGYRGIQLQNIQKCINKALQTLDTCPGVQHEDWDVKGDEWTLYRKRVVAAVEELEEFAEGDEQTAPEAPVVENRFQAVNFGLKPNTSNQGLSFAKSARMAESRVPWKIYENLRNLYRVILGDPGVIIAQSQDWIEATVGLTAWWDGEDDDAVNGDNALGASTANFGRSRLSKSRVVDETPEDAYLQRLDLAFNSATNDTSRADFRVNSLNGLEVGLASVLEGNVEGVLGLLQTWSLCIASAVAEVASAGGWMEAAPGTQKPPGLSENDLMVLSYGQEGQNAATPIRRDDVLSAYASGLFERRSIENETGVRDGWELSLEILSRLEDSQKMQKSVSELLEKLPLDTAEQMDKVVLLCSEIGLDNEGRRVSERYGDLTVSKSEEYGLALVCYARAHSRRKVKSLVELLISYSLVQSHAFPVSAELDDQLRALIREPKTCLSAIAGSDEEAASILQFYFSGYATLRRFYETRDEAVALSEGQRPRFKPLARRRAAAQALVAVIRSASDSIHGGLYDPDRDTAVQVDGLLALLGETLVFMDEPAPILSVLQQLTILSAIEDLETVTSRVYAQCEECFRSTLLEYHSGDQSTSSSYVLPPSPRTLLKKSVSATTAPSNFSLIGNDMLESARTRSTSGSGSASSSGVLVPRPGDGVRKSSSSAYERGWDWRVGLTEESRGEDILRMLRLGLARGLSLGGV